MKPCLENNGLRRVLISICLVLAFASCAAGAGGAGGQALVPAPCPSFFAENLTVDCGFLSVPESRTTGAGREIRLAVAIVRAQERTEPDPVLFLMGGPSFPAINPFSLAYLRDSPLLEGRDLILLDQRGVGASEPFLFCPEPEQAYIAGWPADTTRRTEQKAIGSCRDRFRGEGIDLSAYNMTETAADLQDLRHALGYEQWNVLGVSAGSLAALTAMRLYPEGIRSVILDSAYGVEFELQVDDVVAGARTLEKTFAGCASNQVCAAAHPALRSRFFALVARLDRRPVGIRHEIVGGGALTEEIDGDRFLADTIDCSRGGPFCALEIPTRIEAALSEGIASLYDGGPVDPPTPEPPLVANAKTFSYFCHDLVPFAPPQHRAQTARMWPDYRGLIFGDTFWEATCRTWDVGVAEADQGQPVTSLVPTLVLAGDWDGTISPDHGAVVAATLPRSRYVRFPGLIHLTLYPDPVNRSCPSSIAAAFLTAPTTSLDTSCVASMTGLDFTGS